MSRVTEEEPDPRTIVGTFLMLEQVAQSTTSLVRPVSQFMNNVY